VYAIAHGQLGEYPKAQDDLSSGGKRMDDVEFVV